MNFSGGAYDFGGGGFMPTQSNAAASTEQPSSRRSTAPSSGLFPLTVKQIFSALQASVDDNLCVDGQDVSNVTLVGLMFNKEEKQTDVTFMLDDGTGRLEVKRWIEAPDSPEALELKNVHSGNYVRVHGHLRTFQNKRTIIAFSVKPITDFNEVTFHFLECIFVHLHNIKIKGGGSTIQAPSSFTMNTPAPASFGNAQAPSSFNAPPSPAPSAAHASAVNSNQPASTTVHELNDLQRRILGVFEEPANIKLEQGLFLNDVMQKLRMPEATFRPAVSFLINEGFIYSTIDDMHYRSTLGS